MKTLFCIGELLIDWISTDIDSSLIESVNFIKKAGGAPANVAIAASRLGTKVAFAGKIGKDPFGLFLKETLEKDKVNTDNLLLSEEPTTFAFVSIKKGGDRDFVFQRGADELLKMEEVKLPKSNAVFHFGSATGFLGGDLTDTYLKALEYAHKKDFFISFDPNYRSVLWNQNISEFIKLSHEFINKSDFIKLSDEEALLISGKKDLKQAIESFKIKENAIICVTLGKKGTLLHYQNHSEIIPSIVVEAVDTTGAGDAFVGAMLKQICEKSPDNYEVLKAFVRFANIVAGISTTEFGALEALPTQEKISKSLHLL